MLHKGPARRVRRRDAISGSIFGDDGGSRLFWEFVDTGLAEYAAMGAYEYNQAGILMTFLCGNPEMMESNFDVGFKMSPNVFLPRVLF